MSGWPSARFGAFHVLAGMTPAGRPKFGGPADCAAGRSDAAAQRSALARTTALQVHANGVCLMNGDRTMSLLITQAQLCGLVHRPSGAPRKRRCPGAPTETV